MLIEIDPLSLIYYSMIKSISSYMYKYGAI